MEAYLISFAPSNAIKTYIECLNILRGENKALLSGIKSEALRKQLIKKIEWQTNEMKRLNEVLK